jgi:hypothetical protein
VGGTLSRKGNNYAKTYIEMSKWHIVALVFMLTGLILLAYGCNAYYNIRVATNLAGINSEKLRKGQYIKGEITKYAGRKIETVGGERFYGVSYSVTVGFTTYDVYTVPTYDGKYVSLYVKDDEKKDKLGLYDNGYGNGVSIVGKVVETKFEPNYEFWEASDIFESEEEMKDKIISNYVIKEINYKKRQHRIYEGLFIMAAAWIVFRIGGKVKVK